METVVADKERQLFIVQTEAGVSTCGFDWVFRQLSRLAMKVGIVHADQSLWLSDQLVDPAKVGTLEQYDQYRSEFAKIADRPDLGTWFDMDTDRKVQMVLEHARRNGSTLRLFYGDRDTGHDWMEEHDVVGTIARSMGPMKVPLILAPGQRGGGAISDRNVVRILNWETGVELYRHPKYQVPELSIQSLPEAVKSERVQLTHEVVRDGRPVAAFESFAAAAAWVGYMTGESCLLAARAIEHRA